MTQVVSRPHGARRTRQPRGAAVHPGPRRRERRAGDALVFVVDAAALAVAGAVTGAPWPAVGGYLLGGLLLLAGTGRQRPPITLRLGNQLPGILGCALSPALLLVPYAGAAALLAVPAAAITVTAGRSAGYAALRAARRRRLVAEPTLLVGAGRLGCEIADILAAHPEFGLTPYGFVDSRPPARAGPLPLLGDVPALPQVLSAHRITRVIVCFPDCRDEALVPVLRALRSAPVSVCLVPRLYELGQAGSAARDEVWGIPLVPLRRASRVGPVAKRAIDVVVAVLLLIALAPLLVVLAPVARAASGGSALFRQARVTGGGRVTTVVKLRSLAPDPAGDAATDTRWTVPAERYTRLGSLLRVTHADELPQLVNVLRGDMSLVGPRPERPYFAAFFAEQFPGYADRQRMPAGITGWAQVHGLCGETSVAERARFDNRYVEDWSLWLDLVILVRTLATVFPRRAGGS